MKNVAILMIIAAMLTGCASSKVINGKTYEPYGLLSTEKKDPAIVYAIPAANWIVGILCSESILIPGYIILFDLYEPVGGK